MTDAEWRPIKGYEGTYEVSSDGRVRSLDRLVVYRTGQRRRWKGQERKTFLVKDYPHCTLGQNGEKQNAYIHLLVCEAFHGPRPSPQHECRHLNGDPTDNRVENVCWGTKSENAQDTIRNGRNKELNKTHCKNGHPFDELNTAYSPAGTRRCRECARLANSAYYEKNRQKVCERTRNYHRRIAAQRRQSRRAA